MKKICAALISVLIIISLLAGFSASAYNEKSFSVASTYYTNGALYSFLLSDYGDGVLDQSFYEMKNNSSLDDKQTPHRLSYVNTLAKYMFLIDASTSMYYNRDEMTSLAKGIIENDKNKVSFTVAVFGEKFEIIGEDIKDAQSVENAVNGIDYNHQATDICSGLNDAIDYMSDKENRGNEIMNIILFTDGIPYLSDDGNDEAQLKSGSEKLKKKIKNSPEVIVHSVVFGDWNETVFDAVSAGTGQHTSVWDEYSAYQTGNKVAEFIDGFYLLYLPYKPADNSYRFDVSIYNENTSELVSVNSVCNYDNVNARLSKKPGGTGGTTVPAPTERDTGDESKNTEQTTTKPSETKSTAGTSAPETNSTINATADETKTDNNNNLLLIVIVCSACVLALIIAAIIFIKSRKARAKGRSKAIKNNGGGVLVTVKTVSGEIKNRDLEFNLSDELIIGSDKSCDIVFDDSSVAPRNTRIYINEGIIYIEDLNYQSNTSIEGMKIYSPNKLRSGDTISMGDVSFKLLF